MQLYVWLLYFCKWSNIRFWLYASCSFWHFHTSADINQNTTMYWGGIHKIIFLIIFVLFLNISYVFNMSLLILGVDAVVFISLLVILLFYHQILFLPPCLLIFHHLILSPVPLPGIWLSFRGNIFYCLLISYFKTFTCWNFLLFGF